LLPDAIIASRHPAGNQWDIQTNPKQPLTVNQQRKKVLLVLLRVQQDVNAAHYNSRIIYQPING
jgi:hypothetical protein